MACSIESGLICWISGPHQPGPNPDDVIFRRPGGLDSRLPPFELLHADSKYLNMADGRPLRCITPVTPTTNAMRNGNKVARARLETVNGKFKRFKVLSNTFRHNVLKHGDCFYAVAALIQAMLQIDEIPYDIGYTE